MAASFASAADLTKNDKEWLLRIIAAFVIANCNNGYQLDSQGAVRWGLLNGADVQRLVPAFSAVTSMAGGRSYDCKELDPPVVEEFYRARMTLLLMYDEKAMCSIEHGRALERDGFLRRQLQ
jgi:hypothetical protein